MCIRDSPMDMNLNYSEDDSPLALKSDFILSLCELVIGGKEGLQPVDKTVIDRAVRNVYRDYLCLLYTSTFDFTTVASPLPASIRVLLPQIFWIHSLLFHLRNCIHY